MDTLESVPSYLGHPTWCLRETCGAASDGLHTGDWLRVTRDHRPGSTALSARLYALEIPRPLVELVIGGLDSERCRVSISPSQTERLVEVLSSLLGHVARANLHRDAG